MSQSDQRARDGGSPAATASAERAIAAAARGDAVVLLGDGGSPSHVVVAASACEPHHVMFMARWARGLVCLALTDRRCAQLGLRPMQRSGHAAGDLAMTVSIEARDGVTTGISAADRALTIAVATAPGTVPLDLVTPGHVFPLRAHEAGLAGREGPVEAAVALMELAGQRPAAVVCAVLADDGGVAEGPELEAFVTRHGLAAATIHEIAEVASVPATVTWRGAGAREACAAP